jgi:hypothetical protein
VSSTIYKRFAAGTGRPPFFEGVSQVRPSSGWTAGFDGYRVDLPIGSDAVIQSEIPVSLY